MNKLVYAVCLVSLLLNVALLSGCQYFPRLVWPSDEDRQIMVPKSHGYDATDDLREIACRLGVEEDGRIGSELAEAIKTQIYVEASAKGFPSDLLTEEQMKDVKEYLPKASAEIIETYQAFIKSLDGKRYIAVP